MTAPVDRAAIIAKAEELAKLLRTRGETHGSGRANFDKSAELLNVAGFRRLVFGGGHGAPALRQLDALDVIVVYDLLKSAREITGDRFEPDHFFDKAGYGVIGTTIAGAEKAARNPVNEKGAPRGIDAGLAQQVAKSILDTPLNPRQHPEQTRPAVTNEEPSARYISLEEAAAYIKAGDVLSTPQGRFVIR